MGSYCFKILSETDRIQVEKITAAVLWLLAWMLLAGAVRDDASLGVVLESSRWI